MENLEPISKSEKISKEIIMAMFSALIENNGLGIFFKLRATTDVTKVNGA